VARRRSRRAVGVAVAVVVEGVVEVVAVVEVGDS
jgi:hypothetical protein